MNLPTSLLVLGVALASAPLSRPHQVPSTAQVAKTVSPAVVLVKAKAPAGLVQGSGFVVDSTGIVVTNLHVVEGAEAIQIQLQSGDVFDSVKVRAFDERKDLAILQVPGFKLPVVTLGDSDEVEVGSTVVVIGSPSQLENSVSVGVISGVRTFEGFRAFQTDAAVNPGSSGGPLLNAMGFAIGVMTFKKREAESISFAIPINYVRGLLPGTDSLSLEAFALRLGSNSSRIIDGHASRHANRWKSLRSGTIKILRSDGDFLYVEHVGQEGRAGSGSVAITELRKVGGAYVGAMPSSFSCQHPKESGLFGTKMVLNTCSIDLQMSLSFTSPTRLEGTIESVDSRDVDCATCQVLRRTTERFTWIAE